MVPTPRDLAVLAPPYARIRYTELCGIPRPPRPRLPRLPAPVPGIRGTYCIRGRLIRSAGAAPAPLAPYSHLSPRGTIGGRACGVGVPAARGGARSSSSARGAVCGAAPAPAPWTVSGTKRSVNARQATLSYRRPTATALTSSPPSSLASRAATTAPTAPPERTSHRPRSLHTSHFKPALTIPPCLLPLLVALASWHLPHTRDPNGRHAETGPVPPAHSSLRSLNSGSTSRRSTIWPAPKRAARPRSPLWGTCGCST